MVQNELLLCATVPPICHFVSAWDVGSITMLVCTYSGIERATVHCLWSQSNVVPQCKLPFQSIAISCFCLIACCGCFVLCSPTKLLQHLVQAVAEDRMTSTAVVGVQKTQQELTKKVLKRVTNVGK